MKKTHSAPSPLEEFPHLRTWNGSDCADFVSEGCGLPKYASSFRLNVRTGPVLLALDAKQLCEIGVQSLSDQRTILEKIRQLAQTGVFQHHSTHFSWRQQLMGALKESKEGQSPGAAASKRKQMGRQRTVRVMHVPEAAGPTPRRKQPTKLVSGWFTRLRSS